MEDSAMNQAWAKGYEDFVSGNAAEYRATFAVLMSTPCQCKGPGCELRAYVNGYRYARKHATD